MRTRLKTLTERVTDKGREMQDPLSNIIRVRGQGRDHLIQGDVRQKGLGWCRSRHSRKDRGGSIVIVLLRGRRRRRRRPLVEMNLPQTGMVLDRVRQLFHDGPILPLRGIQVQDLQQRIVG